MRVDPSSGVEVSKIKLIRIVVFLPYPLSQVLCDKAQSLVLVKKTVPDLGVVMVKAKVETATMAKGLKRLDRVTMFVGRESAEEIVRAEQV